MNLVVQGSSNFNLSERMKNYISKRVSKISYFKPHINEISFHLSSEKNNYRVDSNIVTHKFGVFKFHTTAREMYTAIDKIVHKMDVKIYREKSKIKSHKQMGHEELVQFFEHHEEDKAEPTHTTPINEKPTTLLDAFLEMKDSNHKDFQGFVLIEENSSAETAFIRKLDDNIYYLFKSLDTSTYIEYSLKVSDKAVEINEKIRELPLAKLSLLDAQREILEKEYHFDLFVDSETNKVSFLFKLDNGKWEVLS